MIESMYGMGVDTLKAARALEKAGFESAQAEALVAAFGGSVAGGAATREYLRDLRNANREDNRALRDELKGEIAELRKDMGVMKADIAELKTGLVRVRSGSHDDIKSLKAQMYGLLLAQATLIVGLVVGLQRLL